MTKKQKLNRKLVAILVFIIGMIIIFSSCNPKLCPTYDSAVRAKEQKIEEKKGGETGACIYITHVTKKQKKKSNKIWTSDFCYVKKKKWKP